MAQIDLKSKVLRLGLKLKKQTKTQNEKPVILWNHRWEYDKNPKLFFQSLESVLDLDWELIVLGKAYENIPDEFSKYHALFKERIKHWGFVEDIHEYHQLLAIADISLTTAIQDFFGGSVVEAIYAGSRPILPNRLAYNEHVGEKYLFNNEIELNEMLRIAIDEFATWDSDASKMVERYHWPNCISMYDTAFEACVNNFGTKVVT